MERCTRYSMAFLAVFLGPAFLQTGDCNSGPTGNTTLSSLELEVSAQNQILGFVLNDRSYDVWPPAGPNTAVLRAQPADPTAIVTWLAGAESGSLGVGGGEVTLALPAGPSSITLTVRPTGGAVAFYTVRVNPTCGSGGECDDGNECTADVACDLGTGLCPAPTPESAGVVCDVGSIEDRLCDGAGECAPAGSQQWGVPRSLDETANTTDARYPRVAVDPTGNAIAVWQQAGPGFLDPRSIWASRYTPATGWSLAEVLDTEDGVANAPHLAMDPSGNAIAVWHQTDGTRTNLWANHYTLGVGWGGAILAETDDTGDAELPFPGFGPAQSIGIDPSGNAMVAWLLVAPLPPEFGGELTYNAVVSRYTPGGGWEAQVHLSGNASDPQVGMDAAGNAIALWRSRGGGRVWASNYTAGSGWGPFPLFASRSGAVRGPRMAVDSDGKAVVAWSTCSSWPCYAEDGIYVNRYASATGWEGEQLIYSAPTGYNQTPTVALNDAGDVLVTWRRADNYPTSSLWAMRYTQGAWQAPEELHPGGEFGGPTAAIDAGSNAIVAWGVFFVSQAVPSVPDILASRYVAGVGWETPVVIEANGVAGNAQFPHVNYGADGSAMLIWSDGHNATSGPFAFIRNIPGLLLSSPPFKSRAL